MDVGGTTLKGAAFESGGRVLVRENTKTFGTTNDPLRELRGLIQRLKRAAPGDITGIGIATAGTVDPLDGRIHLAANLGWRDLALQELLEVDFDVPVHIEHDARAGALAEQLSAPVCRPAGEHAVFVPIGTGVAAAAFASGQALRGATGAAGEFGHLQVVPDGDLCRCGQRGCVEAYASATNVLKRYRRLGGRSCRSTPELVANLQGDPVARRVWGDLVETLARGLSAITAVLDPSEIVIGGGLSNAGSALIDPLLLAFERNLAWRARPPIRLSSLGADAGLIGAALTVDAQSTSIDFTTNAAASLRTYRA